MNEELDNLVTELERNLLRLQKFTPKNPNYDRAKTEFNTLLNQYEKLLYKHGRDIMRVERRIHSYRTRYEEAIKLNGR